MPLTIPGIDYAWGKKPYDAFSGTGVRFVMRYLSHDPAKDLTHAEVLELWKRDISVGVVWESTSGRALGGRKAGHADAVAADTGAKAVGLAGIPIYFAVDFDADDKAKPVIAAYMAGAADAIGKRRVGVYGSYYVVKYLHDHNACAWFWQTYAWSGGNVHPATHIYQWRNGVTIGGLSCDLDKARSDVPFGVRGPKHPQVDHAAARRKRQRATWLAHLKKELKRVAKLRHLIRRKK